MDDLLHTIAAFGYFTCVLLPIQYHIVRLWSLFGSHKIVILKMRISTICVVLCSLLQKLLINNIVVVSGPEPMNFILE